MTVGFILEGGPSSPDKRVFKLLAERLRPGTEVAIIPLGPKQTLISRCGEVTAMLFEKGCSCVIIVWDLYPAWGVHGSKPCLKKDRDAINESLAAAGVTSSKVHLVCIHKMLEAWLLADEKALSAVLTKLRNHKITVPRVRRPEDPVKPKNVLSQIFGTLGGTKFQAYVHAEPIINEVKDLKKLDRCKSFTYFRLKLADC